MKKEIILDLKKVNIIGIVTFLIAYLLSIKLQLLLHSDYYFKFSWISILYLVAIIFLHEGLHGIGFRFIAKAPANKVKFGIVKKYLMPYCSCSNYEITKTQYIVTMLLPNIILSIVTFIILLSNSNLFWSIILCWVVSSGAGDYYMAFLVSKYPKGTKFMDHPTQPVFYII